MTEITRRPSWLGSSLALVAALAAVLATALAAVTAAAAGLVGLAILGAGLVVASRRVVTAGGAVLLLGVLYGGYAGGAPEPLLAAALFGVLAWDVGSNAVSLGDQLGRETDTRRAETVHAAASLAVGAFAVAIGYGVFVAAAGGQPLAALVFLVIGAVALVSGFR